MMKRGIVIAFPGIRYTCRQQLMQDCLADVYKRQDVNKGVVLHGLGKVYRVQYFHPVACPLEQDVYKRQALFRGSLAFGSVFLRPLVNGGCMACLLYTSQQERRYAVFASAA